MRAVGLGNGASTYSMPITQGDLAAATGLSTVHVNRSLQSMRKSKLITYDKSVLTVLDWEGLQEAGDFDPSYLSISSPSREPAPAVR
jgi:hypothetical protein